MAEEKKDSWLNYLALTTVILAVSATLATSKGNSHSTSAIMYQAQATNQWSYYQAKAIKGYLYEVQKEMVELEARDQAPDKAGNSGEGSATSRESLGERAARYDKKIAGYAEDKALIQREAKRLESLRDDARRHGATFSSAVVLLQIAILLSSIAALLKKKPLWYLGMAVGAAGIFYFADGFLLFQ
jgi:hypothetical protein